VLRTAEGDADGRFRRLAVLDLESPDPRVLAEFYHRVLGWDITLSQDEYAEISNGNTRILFTRAEGYQGSGWPASTAPKRYHLCMAADDVFRGLLCGLGTDSSARSH
jgi:Glyoxalase-like domain